MLLLSNKPRQALVLFLTLPHASQCAGLRKSESNTKATGPVDRLEHVAMDAETTTFGRMGHQLPNEQAERPQTNQNRSLLNCNDASAQDVTGTWVEFVSDMFVDVDNNGDFSTGDIVLIQGNPLQNQKQPFTMGQTMGKCTVLSDREYSFCLLTYSLPGGHVAVSGEFAYMHVVSGGNKCYHDLGDSTVAGYFQGANVMYDVVAAVEAVALDDSARDVERCRGQSATSGPWPTFGLPITTFNGTTAHPGDQIFVQSTVAVPGIEEDGIVLGECTILQTADQDTPFCNLVFGFSDSTIR